jgi:hypothetical protein
MFVQTLPIHIGRDPAALKAQLDSCVRGTSAGISNLLAQPPENDIPQMLIPKQLKTFRGFYVIAIKSSQHYAARVQAANPSGSNIKLENKVERPGVFYLDRPLYEYSEPYSPMRPHSYLPRVPYFFMCACMLVSAAFGVSYRRPAPQGPVAKQRRICDTGRDADSFAIVKCWPYPDLDRLADLDYLPSCQQ